jgi:hypothetical protein
VHDFEPITGRIHHERADGDAADDASVDGDAGGAGLTSHL